jgi:hypothetical protein
MVFHTYCSNYKQSYFCVSSLSLIHAVKLKHLFWLTQLVASLFMIYVVFMQMKDAGLNDTKHHIQELQAAHQQELAEVDRKWHQCLEQKLMEAEARYKEELAELNKEWRWERKVNILCARVDILTTSVV